MGRRSAAWGVQGDAGGVPDPLDRELRTVSRGAGLLVGDHRGGRAHGQPRLADVLLRTRRHAGGRGRLPARALAGDVHRHGPAQARPPEGAVPGGLHAEADRRPRGCDPGDRRQGARRLAGTGDVRPGQRRRPAGGRARDRELHGDRRAGRRGLGETDELDARRRRPRRQPRRLRGARRERRPGDLRALPRS